MDNKQFSRVEIKDADKGEVSAVFATFNVIDKDGDVTLPGAFKDGAEAPISAYGHQSWSGALPVGVGRIRTTATEAIFDGKFFLDTTHGRDTFVTVKELARRKLGDWSYGYDSVGDYRGEFKGKQVRFLPEQVVHEVSPVLIGAGVNTRTLATKGRGMVTATEVDEKVEYKAAIRPHDTPSTARAWDAAAVVSAITDDVSVSDLRSVFAWVDSGGDPETKGSYKFPHHHGVAGPANLRACVAGIAALNGARGGASIPESDRKGVYNHLAGHLRQADREPPELRSGGEPGGLKFQDDLLSVMAELARVNDRASEIQQMRAMKNRHMSPVNIELLGWLYEDYERLGHVLKRWLDTPQEAAAAEHVRFLAQRFKEEFQA